MPPLFPIIDTEALVQENDKTRIDLSKSYVSGTSAFTLLEVKPAKTVDAIEVTENMFLDWQYEFTIEVDAENNKVDFETETDGLLVATLTTGEYTLFELATEILAKMNLVATPVFTGDLSSENAFTFETASELFSLLPLGVNAAVSILPAIGFAADLTGKLTYTGEKVERITKTITLTVENDEDDKEITHTFDVISSVADHLFSTDDKLRKHEENVMKYLPEGRASFKDVHRRAQQLIVDWLATKGYVDNFGNRIIHQRIKDIEEVSTWATMMTLRLIFESIITADDDVFTAKVKKYTGLETFYRDRAVIVIDTNADGEADPLSERLDVQSCRVVRR